MPTAQLKEIYDFFLKVPLFQGINEEDLTKITHKAQIVYFPKHTQIFQQALSPIDGVYFILQGGFELSYESNEEIEHDILNQYEVYGALSILRNSGISLRTVKSKEDTFAYFISQKDFLKLITNYPVLEDYFFNPLNEESFTRSCSQMRNRGNRNQEGFLQVPMKSACKRPLNFCNEDDTVSEVAQIMSASNFGFCMVRKNGQLSGVISDSDIRRAIAAAKPPSSTLAQEIMSPNVKTIQDDYSVLEALLKMERHNLSHIPGIDESGEVNSVLSALDLPQVQSGSPLDFIYKIRQCKTVGETKEIKERLPQVINDLLLQGYSPLNTVQYISRVNDAILRCTIKETLKVTGEAPVDFDFLVLGSEGRLEQTLSGDQDNALIYQDSDDPNIHSWFKNFASLVCSQLDSAGYIYCKGRIMAENDQWCQGLSQWKSNFSRWVDQPYKNNLLNAQIFFDCRHVYGKGLLSNNLRTHLLDDLCPKGQKLFSAMSHEYLKQSPPLGFFNNFAVSKSGEHKNSLDIKYVMNFIVEFARILALESGLGANSTSRRLDELHKNNVLTQDENLNLQRAWNLCLYHRLQHQIQLLEQGEESHNFINPQDLNTLDRDMLKSAFKLIPDLQLKIKLRFAAGISQ
jgi:CBS domain-containing protein